MNDYRFYLVIVDSSRTSYEGNVFWLGDKIVLLPEEVCLVMGTSWLGRFPNDIVMLVEVGDE